MYAVIKTGGKQYKVIEGQRIKIEKIKDKDSIVKQKAEKLAAGDIVKFDAVMISDDKKGLIVGDPIVKNAKVEGKITEYGRDKKIVVFKYKPKKNIRKRQGHRQQYMKVEITKIAL